VEQIRRAEERTMGFIQEGMAIDNLKEQKHTNSLLA
jgi:hypothetical protein